MDLVLSAHDHGGQVVLPFIGGLWGGDQGWFPKCHESMLEYGMEAAIEEERLMTEYEVPYGKKGSPISIELHKSLFPHDSEAYGELNQFFTNVHESTVTITVQGVDIKTLNYTDHLFYLICHAFKHFLHSGFGIRQVCDMVMFANAYGDKIDWHNVLEKCRMIYADQFAAALFKIGEKYLVFDSEKACYSQEWRDMIVDENALLQDLLMSGIFGEISVPASGGMGLKNLEISERKSECTGE